MEPRQILPVGRPRGAITFLGKAVGNRSKNKKPEYYRQQDRDRSARNYARKKEWFADLKRSTGCAICGETEPCCLDYHHRNQLEKEFTISSYVTVGKSKLLKEIDKCILVCSNCHRKIHNGIIELEEMPMNST